MKTLTRIFLIAALFAFASLGTTFAASISKTFELGPGTQNSVSVFRTFPVPCSRQVAAVVKFKRLGPAAASNDISIIIELREPDTSPNVEGPLVEPKPAKATTTEQTVTIFSASGGSPRGCSLPWRVRVKANGVTPQFAISGTIRVDYDASLQNISIPFTGVIFSGESKTINFGTVAGLSQGTIVMTANWHHQLTTVLPGPNPIRLKIELIPPSGGGSIVSVSAFSSNEARTNLTAFKLTHKVNRCVSGQWKLKITNIDQHTVALDSATTKFTPGC